MSRAGIGFRPVFDSLLCKSENGVCQRDHTMRCGVPMYLSPPLLRAGPIAPRSTHAFFTGTLQSRPLDICRTCIS